MLDVTRAALGEMLGGRPISALDYAELRTIAKEWFRRVDAWLAGGRGAGAPAAGDRVPRRFGTVIAVSATLRLRHGSLGAAVAEVFKICRVRGDVLAYLSLQEGLDMDGLHGKPVHVGMVLDDIMRSAGKVSWGGVSRTWCGFRVGCSLDPMVDLRQIYYATLRAKRSNGERPLHWWHTALPRLRFRWKCRLLGWMGTLGRLGLSMRAPEKTLRGLFRTPAMKRNVVMACLILFPETRQADRRFWDELLHAIESEFVPRALGLVAVMPMGASSLHSYSKMFKVAFGLLAWRSSSKVSRGACGVPEVMASLRLAWLWGLTYPLVDDVLDGGVPRQAREDTVRVLTGAFAPGEPDPASCKVVTPSAHHLGTAMLEMIAALEPARREQCKAILRLVVEAHVRDSERRSTEDKSLPADDEEDLWADTHLKALLVRMATLELCGGHVDEQQLISLWCMASFNQLGDDLWDVVEDTRFGRVTPMTVTIAGGGRRNAVEWYLRYGDALSRCFGGKRGIALRAGVRETVRSLVDGMEGQGRDPLVARVGSVLATSMGFADPDGVRRAVAGWPHVDPDAVIFGMESALF